MNFDQLQNELYVQKELSKFLTDSLFKEIEMLEYENRLLKNEVNGYRREKGISHYQKPGHICPHCKKHTFPQWYHERGDPECVPVE